MAVSEEYLPAELTLMKTSLLLTHNTAVIVPNTNPAGPTLRQNVPCGLIIVPAGSALEVYPLGGAWSRDAGSGNLTLTPQFSTNSTIQCEVYFTWRK